MYSGLLPKGLTEDDLSPDEEAEQEDVEERREGEKGSVENLSSAAKNTSSVVETQPINTANDADSDSPTCSMPGISQEMWQKFQDLRKQKDEIKMMKVPGRRRRRRHKKGAESEEPTETSRECQVKREKPWDELQQYFGVNDRFHPPACSKPPPKSGLEKSIERAIAEGDIAKAEEMSDRLATREMAVKIAQAADCRDFVQRKQEEEALRAAQKRKKQIAWGFEAKKRWETKSNMGYM
ncbi:protein FAM204A isoform X1 [Acanthochromis polyacanthus]|uniref:Family with sequence similarity 204 member A n=1 Tax=Acanthochromis polyacanthus TaxID=80966 RepID=A0A3Q1F855_9TELE|nr:protein FAM204A isoform X1 [Acanthochromis polyacanthus]